MKRQPFAAIVVPFFVLVANVARAAAPQEFILDEPTRKRCVQILKEGVASDEFWPAMHAAEGLTLGGHGAETTRALTPKLATVTDAQQRCGVARELVRAGDRSKAAILLEVLASSDPHGHVHAAESLYKVGEIGDGSALRAAFARTTDPRLPIMAAGALARAGNARAFEHLRTTLDHDDPQLYRLAAWILGVIGDASDVPRLKKTLSRAPDEVTRSYVEHALAMLGDADGVRALERNLKSSDVGVRTQAATFLGDGRIAALAPRLRPLLDDANLDVRVRAAQSLLFLGYESRPRPPLDLATGETDADGVQRIPLLPPRPNNPRNSEGDFVQLHDGRLLFVYTHFTGGAGDHAPAHLASRVSHDGGRTWSKRDDVVVPNDGGFNVMSVSLLRLRDGRLALFHVRKNSNEDCRPLVRFSADEAQSWSAPLEIVPDRERGYYVLNNDRVVQLASGRLVVPVAQHYGDGREKWTGYGRILCYVSDDLGRTWTRGAPAEADAKNGRPVLLQEPGVVALSDGRLMIFCRTDAGSQYVGHSQDGGATWSKLEPSPLLSPVSPASIERIPATGELLAVWNDHAGIDDARRGKRTPLSLALSSDDGRTWKTVRTLEANPHGWYCYAAIEFVGGDVLVGHCAGDRRENNGLASTQITRVPIRSLSR